jgi:hypothetical protein
MTDRLSQWHAPCKCDTTALSQRSITCKFCLHFRRHKKGTSFSDVANFLCAGKERSESTSLQTYFALYETGKLTKM